MTALSFFLQAQEAQADWQHLPAAFLECFARVRNLLYSNIEHHDNSLRYYITICENVAFQATWARPKPSSFKSIIDVQFLFSISVRGWYSEFKV